MDESLVKSNIGLYVQNMLEQVSASVEHLLDNLSFIYKSHGITFSIKHNHSVLMRMLAPFELLSQFKVDDNSDIVGNMFYAKWRQSSNSHPDRLKTLRDETDTIIKVENKKESKESNNSSNQKGVSSSDFAAERDKSVKKERLNISQEPPRQKRKYERKVKEEPGNEPTEVFESKYNFSKEKEEELVGWIERKLKDRYWKVLLNDVKVHAKKIANNNTFCPNLTWVRKFLARYPELKTNFQAARAYYRSNYHAIEKEKRNSERQAKVSDEQHQYSDQEPLEVDTKSENKAKSEVKKIQKIGTKKNVEPIESESDSDSESDGENEGEKSDDYSESNSRDEEDEEYEEDEEDEEEEEESSEEIMKEEILAPEANLTSIATQSIRSCKAFNKPKEKC